MAENQVQSEKKMTSLNVSSETRDAIKDISTSLGLSQADTVARLVDGYHPNATPGVKAALDASAVLDEAVERVKHHRGRCRSCRDGGSCCPRGRRRCQEKCNGTDSEHQI